MSTINERMKELRKSMLMSQVDFANILGVTGAHISKIEKGKTVPSESLIKLICKEFGIFESWLKDGKGEMDKDIAEDVIDDEMCESTEQLNRLLKSESLNVRALASKLNLVFTNILTLELDDTKEETQVKYLEAIYGFLGNVSNYLNLVKCFSSDGVFPVTSVDVSLLNDSYKKMLLENIDNIKLLLTEKLR